MFNRKNLTKVSIGLSIMLFIVYDLMIMSGSYVYLNSLKIYPEIYVYSSILLLNIFGIIVSKNIYHRIINICLIFAIYINSYIVYLLID